MYHHLTRDQRCQIYAFKESKKSQAYIARELGVSPATISRELKRNGNRTGYIFDSADRKARDRRSDASRRPTKMTPQLIEKIERYLIENQWSPEQISGFLKRNGEANVSHERIYQHVWEDKKKKGNLHKHLRHSGRKYCARKGKTAGRGVIPNRTDISERPAIVETKSRIGDFEGDTIIGANHKGAILSHVDRMSKFTKLILLPSKESAIVVEACKEALGPIAEFMHTITYDNGKEFSQHADIAELLDVQCFFAKPYHSWERGLNEHTNGLVRQYFPKGTDFTILTQAEVQAVEDKLNSRPRKILGYRTPREVFLESG